MSLKKRIPKKKTALQCLEVLDWLEYVLSRTAEDRKVFKPWLKTVGEIKRGLSRIVLRRLSKIP